jgi:hypothetical protein
MTVGHLVIITDILQELEPPSSEFSSPRTVAIPEKWEEKNVFFGCKG